MKKNTSLRIAAAAVIASVFGWASQAQAEPVTFETSDGVTISGEYFGPATPKGAIVLHHGLGSVGGEWTAFAEFLSRSGYGVLIYDARGHGKSTLTKSGKRLDFHYFFGRGLKSEWGKMIDDMDEAVKFLAKTQNLDPKKIGVGGASIGANIAFRYAASHPDAAWAILLSPGMDYQGIMVSDVLPSYLKTRRRLLVVASKADRYAYQSAGAMKDVCAYLGSGAQSTFVVEKSGHGVQMFARKKSDEPSPLEAGILRWMEGIK